MQPILKEKASFLTSVHKNQLKNIFMIYCSLFYFLLTNEKFYLKNSGQCLDIVINDENQKVFSFRTLAKYQLGWPTWGARYFFSVGLQPAEKFVDKL